MKFVIILAVLAMCTLVNCSREHGGLTLAQREMIQANKSIQIVLQAAIPSAIAPASNDTQYLWDLLDPISRFLLLNQTAISSGQQFNVTLQLVQNQTISWLALTPGVQTALLNEGTVASAILNLTFANWGWSQASDKFASTTLLSLISTQGQQALLQINTLLAPLNFNTVLNTTILTQSNPYVRPAQVIAQTIWNIQQVIPFNQYRFKRGGGYHRQPTPFDVIEQVEEQASRVLRQNAAGNGLRKQPFMF
jgi:hypothetical protein